MNLSRFVSISKFRPFIFRNTHSSFLADRFEDLSRLENSSCTRKMLFWANVPGSFTRGNLDGKLFIVEFFIEFRFTNTSLAVSQGEGHRMVMDFQT